MVTIVKGARSRIRIQAKSFSTEVRTSSGKLAHIASDIESG